MPQPIGALTTPASGSTGVVGVGVGVGDGDGDGDGGSGAGGAGTVVMTVVIGSGWVELWLTELDDRAGLEELGVVGGSALVVTAESPPKGFSTNNNVVTSAATATKTQPAISQA